VNGDLEELARELERSADRLRGGQVGGEEAAALVERCAELATQLVAELDRRAQESQESHAELPLNESLDQERLL
jgi:hypothetical protein